jgi:ribonuclease HI
MLAQLDNYTVEHVKRKYNKRADEMANKAMDGVILTS